MPTWRHHCLAHVLSNANVGTVNNDTEVWGGPLDGGDFVLALVNRATTGGSTLMTAAFEMLEVSV